MHAPFVLVEEHSPTAPKRSSSSIPPLDCEPPAPTPLRSVDRAPPAEWQGARGPLAKRFLQLPAEGSHLRQVFRVSFPGSTSPKRGARHPALAPSDNRA